MAIYGLNQWYVTQNAYWLYLEGLGVLYLFLLVSPVFIGPPVEQKNPNSSQVFQKKVTSLQGASQLGGALGALVLMMVTWAAVPDAFGLPVSLANKLTLSSSVATVFGVGVVFAELAAIAEERFTRYAVFNRVLYWTRSRYAAIIVSAVVFWVIHVPRYFFDPQAQAIVLIAGIAFAGIDDYFHSLLPSTVAHMIWNFVVTGLAVVGIGSPVALMLVLPLSMLPYLFAHVAHSFGRSLPQLRLPGRTLGT